jgi:hypothetical protein
MNPKRLGSAAAIALCLALLVITQLWAATTPNSFVTAQTPNRGIVQFLQGTDVAGTYKTLYTAAANGSKCNGMYLTSDDATSHLVTIQLTNGGIRYGGIAINSGTTTPGFANGAPAIQPMSQANWPGLPIDSDTNPYILLVSGDTIQATFATALTSSTRINIYVSCADF